MRSDNLDKVFIDSSWKEMKSILDKEMPVEKNRKVLFIWLFGLLFLIALVIAVIELYNKNLPQKKMPTVIADTHKYKEIYENPINEAPTDNLNNLRSEIDNSINHKSKIEEEVLNRFTIENSMKPNNSVIQFSNHIAKNSSVNVDKKDGQYDKSVTEPKDEIMVSNEIQNLSLESNYVIAPIESKLLMLHPQVKLFPGLSNFHEIKPIVSSEGNQKRIELSISSRIYDQSDLNGELGLRYNILNQDFSILPGIGIGYDGYHSSREGITIDDKTLISSNVRYLNSFEVSAPSFSASGPIELNQNRSFYLSPQLNLRKRISRSLLLNFGVLSRIYTKAEEYESSVLADTPDAGSTDPESEKDNQSVENSLDLNQDRQNEFLTAGLSWAIKESLCLDVNFLHQMDKSLSLKPYNDENSAYNNVLEKVNRNEIRIGITYKF